MLLWSLRVLTEAPTDAWDPEEALCPPTLSLLFPLVLAASWAQESLLFSCPIDENCKDKHYNCNVVVQARLCVYNYYKTACCASCTRVASRHTGFLGRR